MRSILAISSAIACTALVTATVIAAEPGRGDGSPVFDVKLPGDYRNWQLISVAHEAGNINDIRAILGNDIAMKAFREGKIPYPDGTTIVRVAWTYVPSDKNNAIFGRAQSFVAGQPTNIQVSVKDSQKYGSTGGWGYGQFEKGKPDPSVTLISTCFPCHARADKSDDLVFTHYAP